MIFGYFDPSFPLVGKNRFSTHTLSYLATIDIVKQHLVKYPRILICVGSYTIGKERIFTAIANEIKAQIWGSTEKVRVLKTLSDPIIESNLTRTSCNAQIHVVEMHKVHSVHFRKNFIILEIFRLLNSNLIVD